eukprot:14390683-Alexandrium_andersonii.AAC.1
MPCQKHWRKTPRPPSACSKARIQKHKALRPLSESSATESRDHKTSRPPSARSAGRSHDHQRGLNAVFLQSFWNG